MTTVKLPSFAKGWQWRKFGDCAQFINGRAYSQHELLDSGTPVLRIQNLNGGDRWYYSNLKLPDEKYCEAGDLLYAWSASFGPYRFNGPKSIFHYHIWRVVPGPELDKDFVFYLLDEITAKVKSAARGVAMLHMTKGGIEAWPIPLPPLAEQKRIAAILDAADALRTKRREALAQLDALLQSTFLTLFGDPVENPKKIKTAKLGSLCVRVTDGTHQSPKWADSGHPFLFVSNIVTGVISFETKKFISDETHAELTRRCPIERGDVLYSTVGSYGVPVVVRTERKFAFQRHIAHLKPDKNLLDSEFLAAMLASPPLQRQADRAAKGVAQKTVNLAEISKFVVFAPPLPLQQKFAAIVESIERQKTTQRAHLAELDALFAALQHRAFRGEI